MTYRATILPALAFGLALAAPAAALENPLVVEVRAIHGGSATGNATLFQSGGSLVLVNLQAKGGTPSEAAVTLETGACGKPGSVAFALSNVSNGQSTTELKHPLSEIAGKAKSLVIHRTKDETSPAVACGSIKSS